MPMDLVGAVMVPCLAIGASISLCASGSSEMPCQQDYVLELQCMDRTI